MNQQNIQHRVSLAALLKISKTHSCNRSSSVKQGRAQWSSEQVLDGTAPCLEVLLLLNSAAVVLPAVCLMSIPSYHQLLPCLLCCRYFHFAQESESHIFQRMLASSPAPELESRCLPFLLLTDMKPRIQLHQTLLHPIFNLEFPSSQTPLEQRDPSILFPPQTSPASPLTP